MSRACRLSGHPRIAERADQDRIEGAQQIVATRRDRLACRKKVIGAPRQVVHIHAAERLQHFDSLSDDLRPDAVARDHCNAVGHESYSISESGAEAAEWVYSAGMKRFIPVPLVLIAITVVVSAQSTQRGPAAG